MLKIVKKKIFLGALSLFIVALAGSGVWLYNALFVHDPLMESQLVDQFGEDFFYFFDLDGSFPDSENEPAAPPEDEGSSESEPAQPPAGGDQSTDTAPPPPPAPPQVTKESIVARYELKFRALQALAEERLEDLFNEAVSEYEQQKEDGTLDRIKLTTKYIQAGRMLENSVDEQFYSLLYQLKAELESHGFSTEIIKQIEKEYQDAKAAKKRELLSRIS